MDRLLMRFGLVKPSQARTTSKVNKELAHPSSKSASKLTKDRTTSRIEKECVREANALSEHYGLVSLDPFRWDIAQSMMRIAKKERARAFREAAQLIYCEKKHWSWDPCVLCAVKIQIAALARPRSQ
jgi:hypothetical protein